MSITIKSPREIELMRQVGSIVANTLQELQLAVEPGITTAELDRMAERSIRRQDGIPAFPFINDFPGTVCISINNEVVHGIPGKRRLKEGDLVKLDTGALRDGYHGDAAVTVGVGEISPGARRLMNVTEEALRRGIAAAVAGGHLFDIGAAIQDYVDPTGLSIVRQYVGHGIGRELHEDPSIPHFRQPSLGIRLREGMTFTIEPMINAGSYETRTLGDDWTVVTADGSLSAQWEHTIAIGGDGPQILTLPDTGHTGRVPLETAKTVQ